MKNKLIFIATFIFIVSIMFSCETYSDYEPQFSPAYPVSGNYYVKNYTPGATNSEDAISSQYEMFIYAASFDADKYVWVNTSSTMSSVSFRVKTEYDSASTVFNGVMLPHSPSRATAPENPTKFITLEETKIIKKEWPTPDSIIMKISVYDSNKVLDSVFYTLGHRTTGQEEPYWDNPTGK